MTKSKSLREVRVTFSNKQVIETNMAAGLTNAQIRNYYKKGKQFNVGNVRDRMAKVKKVEILK